MRHQGKGVHLGIYFDLVKFSILPQNYILLYYITVNAEILASRKFGDFV